MEAAQYEHNTFVTLTYDDDHLPEDNSLRAGDLKLFIRSLKRRSHSPVRFYGCGEYGELDGRPHYHVALFGYSGCDYGITRKRKDPAYVCCPRCLLIKEAWQNKGHIFQGTLEHNSAQYIAGYLAKKFTVAQTVGDRYPPFQRSSKNPPIGHGMLHEIASTLLEHGLDETLPDVPTALSHGTKTYPLGQDMRRKLRTLIGRDKNEPEAAKKARLEKLQLMRGIAWENQEPLTEVVLQVTEGRRRQIHAKQQRSIKRDKI